MKRNIIFTLLLLFATPMALAESYAECRARLVSAYRGAEHANMVAIARDCLRIRPGYVNMQFNLALAQTLNGEFAAALDTLEDLAARNVYFDVDNEPFTALADDPRYQAVKARFESLLEPMGSAAIAFSLQEKDFVPEGIAIEQRDRVLYLGSIRKAKIIRMQADTNAVPFVSTHGWSVFGMRIDAGNRELWVAVAAIPQGEQTPTQELGETAVLRFSLPTGKLLRRYDLPRDDDQRQLLGDLVVANGKIYASDSLTGAVYELDPHAGTWSALIDKGSLHSPQGIVLSADGTRLYVADYTGGLYRLSLGSGELNQLENPEQHVVTGIDGLYRHGNDLIAIQNGVRPHRVVRIKLGPQGNRIVAIEILAAGLEEFDEPTLGQVIGNDFYFVANSHWNRFNASNELEDVERLTGPKVMRLHLD